MHARKKARDALFPARADDVFFDPRRGDIVFRDGAAVRRFAERINRLEHRAGGHVVRPAELAALALQHEVLHAVISSYRRTFPESFVRLRAALQAALGGLAEQALVDFLRVFPPPPVYRALRAPHEAEQDLPQAYRDRTRNAIYLEDELILLWIANRNPAYERVRSVVGDQELGPSYWSFIRTAERFFTEEPGYGPKGETLFDLLQAPGKGGGNPFEQLEFIEEEWGDELGLDLLPFWEKRDWPKDLQTEEDKYFSRGGPGPGEPLLESMRFARKEEAGPAQFSPDLGWMPNVVLVAKSIYVWLDQLAKKYDREISRLDEIPDEELDVLAARHVNALWMIGLFERSKASRDIKRRHGDTQALASAYSLYAYEIAEELGGTNAWADLRDRAWKRGIRLAADMVPNHVGIDGQWVVEHPDWFLQADEPPYPNYRFSGPNLSTDRRVAIHLEDGYWDRTDAAVVFRRTDTWTGKERFIYHGNDGTSMPWNDTAQLDYMQAEVRRAVIETILHVASMFPVIRFDAAMTLAKQHVQRLWFPPPGAAGAIPSRADYAMTEEEFEAAMPVEFWREVVDTVAERAPDTLLLAEAFWMMEGYFVRTLGMHRVYNSAFMNMLKREENEKYKDTIKNVLDFDPEILKRFVNFMNNPDEESAALQFGDGEKYFGVCTLMCTMPGLPMFGHGQFEGLREKYGMEYARARWREQPSGHVLWRHEKQIVPLLEKRYLFSGVSRFALYDFVVGGFVDDDVYAFTNGFGDERALVLFNNRFKLARGTIYASTHRRSIGEELGLDEDLGAWIVMKDLPHGLEYLRPTKDIIDEGMSWELNAYEFHVLTDFRPVTAMHDTPYDRLAAELGGRGVPSVEAAVRELYLRPVHAPLRMACSPGHLAWLASKARAVAADFEQERRLSAVLDERLGHLADGLDWMLSRKAGREVTVERGASLQRAEARFTALRAAVAAVAAAEAAVSVAEAVGDRPSGEDASPGAEDAVDAAIEEAMASSELSTPVLPESSESEDAPDERHEASDPSAKVTAPAGETADHPIGRSAAVDDAEDPSAKVTAPAGEMPDHALARSVAVDDAEGEAEEGAARHEERDDEERDRASGEEAGEEEDEGRAPALDLALLLSFIQIEAAIGVLAEEEAAIELSRSRPAESYATLLENDEPVPLSSRRFFQPLEELSPPDPIADVPPVRSTTDLAMAAEVDRTAEAKKKSDRPILPVKISTTWARREAMVERWLLATPLVEAFGAKGEDHRARRRAALVLLLATLPAGPVAMTMRLALGSERGQTFLDLNRSDGVLWINKERWEELAGMLAQREAACGRATLAEGLDAAAELARLAAKEGYRAEKIAAALGPPQDKEPDEEPVSLQMRAINEALGELADDPTQPPANDD